MKRFLLTFAFLATAGLTSTAYAGPHCPPGYDNVWGACLKRGSGIFNGWRQAAEANTTITSEPTCKPPQISVWGACVDRPQW